MKKLLTLVACAFLFAGSASAHEGSVDLTNAKVSCKGVSLYREGYYRVSGRCDGLMYPYETTYNKYVLWGATEARGEWIRIAEVEEGYFSGNIASPFVNMYITAEKDGLVRKPSTVQVVAGKVDVSDFDKSQTTVVPAASAAPGAAGKGATAQDGTAMAGSTAGAVVGKILTSLLVIVLVIVAIVIGASLIFRSRGSVSA